MAEKQAKFIIIFLETINNDLIKIYVTKIKKALYQPTKDNSAFYNIQ